MASGQIHWTDDQVDDNINEDTKYDINDNIDIPTFDVLLNTLDTTITTLFEDNVFAKSVRKVIENGFDDRQQILDELKDKECMIIDDIIQIEIRKNERAHPQIVKELLSKIFEHNITDTATLIGHMRTKKLSMTLILPNVLIKCSKHHLVIVVIDVTKQLNECGTLIIELIKVRMLFNGEQIDGKRYSKMNQNEFISKCKTYNIRPKNAKRLFEGIHHHFKSKTELYHKIDHNEIFTKWMKSFQFEIKHKLAFDNTTFVEMIKTFKLMPQIAVQLKYDNYKVGLNEKHYDLILKSFIGWALTLKCEYFGCNAAFKLECHCNMYCFQSFVYHFIICIIKLRDQDNKRVLNVAKVITNTISSIADTLCGILSLQFQHDTYFNIFRDYIMEWLQFEFYNFECIKCKHINKTIMMNRIYEYSMSLNYCRVCNVFKNPNQGELNMNVAIQQKQKMNSKAIHTDCSDPLFYVSPAVRYLTLNPKYSTFVQEILLGDVCSLTKTEWDEWLPQIMSSVKSNAYLLQSTKTNKDYGIEEYEAIGINHILAITIYCHHHKYAHQFNTLFSRYKGDENIISNNAYWMARYLSEIVCFFGQDFTAINRKLYIVLPKTMMFSSFVPMLTHPLIVTQMKPKYLFLEIRPKYLNDVHQSKALNLENVFESTKLTKNRNQWLLAGTVRLQINIVEENHFGLALIYLQKLFTQNIFDAKYYYSDELYTQQTRNNVLILIQHRLHPKSGKNKHFGFVLFDYWCDLQQTLHFDTFSLEKDNMNPELLSLFYDERRRRIRIEVLQNIFPNLSTYYDVNGLIQFINHSSNINNSLCNVQQTDPIYFEGTKPWKCAYCCYVNRRIMVDGVYRVYQCSTRCGLCGHLRYADINENENDDEDIKMEHGIPGYDFKLSHEIQSEWDGFNHDLTCSLSNIESLSHTQLIYVLEHHLLDTVKSPHKDALLDQKENIVKYLNENKIDGRLFMQQKKVLFKNMELRQTKQTSNFV